MLSFFQKKTTRRRQYHQSKLNLGLFFQNVVIFQKNDPPEAIPPKKGEHIFKRRVFVQRTYLPSYLPMSITPWPMSDTPWPMSITPWPMSITPWPMSVTRLFGTRLFDCTVISLKHGYLLANIYIE